MGLLPESMVTINRGKISTNQLQRLVTNHSLGSIPVRERNIAIRQFFKYTMSRDPLERLASAYRSKVQRYPLIGEDPSNPHYNWYRAKIYEHTHPQDYQLWKQNGAKVPVKISFSDFVDFWLNTKDYKSNSDPHFALFLKLCQPCRVRYSYYGNFDNFQEDSKVLMRQMGAPPHLLREGYYENKANQNTSHIAKSLYEELNTRQKIGIVEKLSKDIDFYYHIFPEKTDSHKRILNINTELPTSSL